MDERANAGQRATDNLQSPLPGGLSSQNSTKKLTVKPWFKKRWLQLLGRLSSTGPRLKRVWQTKSLPAIYRRSRYDVPRPTPAEDSVSDSKNEATRSACGFASATGTSDDTDSEGSLSTATTGDVDTGLVESVDRFDLLENTLKTKMKSLRDRNNLEQGKPNKDPSKEAVLPILRPRRRKQSSRPSLHQLLANIRPPAEEPVRLRPANRVPATKASGIEDSTMEYGFPSFVAHSPLHAVPLSSDSLLRLTKVPSGFSKMRGLQSSSGLLRNRDQNRLHATKLEYALTRRPVPASSTSVRQARNLTFSVREKGHQTEHPAQAAQNSYSVPNHEATDTHLKNTPRRIPFHPRRLKRNNQKKCAGKSRYSYRKRGVNLTVYNEAPKNRITLDPGIFGCQHHGCYCVPLYQSGQSISGPTTTPNLPVATTCVPFTDRSSREPAEITARITVGAASDEPHILRQNKVVPKHPSAPATSVEESASGVNRVQMKPAQNSASSLHQGTDESTLQPDDYLQRPESPDDEWSSVASLQLEATNTNKTVDPSCNERLLKCRPAQVNYRIWRKRKRVEQQARSIRNTEQPATSSAVTRADENSDTFSPKNYPHGPEALQSSKDYLTDSRSAAAVNAVSSEFSLNDLVTLKGPARLDSSDHLPNETVDDIPKNFLAKEHVSGLTPGGLTNNPEHTGPGEEIQHSSAVTRGFPLRGSLMELGNALNDVEAGEDSRAVKETSATRVQASPLPVWLEAQQLQLISNLTSLTSVLSKVADRISRKSRSSRRSSRTVGSRDNPVSGTSGSDTGRRTPSAKGSTKFLSTEITIPLSATAEVGLQTHFSSASSSTGNLSTTPTSSGRDHFMHKAKKTSSSTRKPHLCASRSFCCSIVRSQKQEKAGSEFQIRVCPSLSQEQVHNCARCQRRQERLGKVVHICRHLSHGKGHRRDRKPQPGKKKSTTSLSQSSVSCSDSMSSSTVSSVKRPNPSTTTLRSLQPFDEQKQLLKQARSSETGSTQLQPRNEEQPMTPSSVHEFRSVSFEIHHEESTFTTDEKSHEESPTRRLSKEELHEKVENLQVERGFVTPVIEMMYHLFTLIGLTYVPDHERVPCHPDDAKTIWNAWKDKLGRLPGSLRRFKTSSCLSGYAQFSFDRLLHFVKMYCTPSDSGGSFSPIPDDDKSAILELFQAGVIEIPINRPKIFVQDAAANQQILQAFVLKSFCTDAEGQARSILRQKFPFYIHLYKTGSAGTLNTEEAKELSSMLAVFRKDQNQLLSSESETLISMAADVWTSQQTDPKLLKYLLELHGETLRWLLSTAVLNYGQSLGSEQAVRMVMSKYVKNWNIFEKDTSSQKAVAVGSNERLVKEPENTKALEDPNKVPKNAKGSKATLISAGLQESLQRFRLSSSTVWPPLCSHSSEKTDSGSQPASPAPPTHAIAVVTSGQAWPNRTVRSSLKVAVDQERNPPDPVRTSRDTRATVFVPSAAPKQFQNLKTKHHLILNQRFRRSETTMRGKGNESVSSSVLETDSSISFELSRDRERR